jgi:hypothetical protein
MPLHFPKSDDVLPPAKQPSIYEGKSGSLLENPRVDPPLPDTLFRTDVKLRQLSGGRKKVRS